MFLVWRRKPPVLIWTMKVKAWSIRLKFLPVNELLIILGSLAVSRETKYVLNSVKSSLAQKNHITYKPLTFISTCHHTSYIISPPCLMVFVSVTLPPAGHWPSLHIHSTSIYKTGLLQLGSYFKCFFIIFILRSSWVSTTVLKGYILNISNIHFLSRAATISQFIQIIIINSSNCVLF